MLTVLPIEDTTVDQSLIIRRSLSFFEKVDEIDLAIVEKLEEYSPRNILALARALKMPKSTVYRRIEKLLNLGLTVEPIINYNKLDLKCGVSLVKPTTGSLIKLYNIIAKVPWFYKFVIANVDTITAKFYEPRRYSGLVEKTLQILRRIGLIDEYELTYTSIELASSKISSEYIDKKSKIIKLKWNKWIKSMAESNCLKRIWELKYLEDNSYSLEVDPIDVKLIEELQENAFQKLRRIGEKLNLSESTIIHHYRKHIVERKVIIKYTPRIMIYHPDLSLYFMGFIKFRNRKSLRIFIYTLWNTPILRRVNKVLGSEEVFASILVPKNEVIRFIGFMDTLCDVGIIQSYKLHLAYLKTFSSWSIPSELFKNEYWENNWRLIKKTILQ